MTNRFVGKPRMRRGSFGVTSPASPGDEVLFRDLRTLHMPRRRITHTDWEADRARETAIPAMVITTAAVAGTAAVNFLSAIRR